MIALAASVAAHAVLLAIRFVAPDALRFEPADPGLEVILVNAKHANAPAKAEALAQANLEGGGTADAGRSKSPLPDLRKTENGDSIKALQKRIVELEQLQLNVLTQAKQAAFRAAPVTDKDKPDPTRTGQDEVDTTRQIARMTAEITQTIEDQNKRPKRTHISPSTRQVGYALYYKAMQKQVEEVGTLNFPSRTARSCTASW